MTIYLKFADEQEAIEVLAAYRDEGGWITATHAHALDVVGTIRAPTGVMLQGAEGEYPETAALGGFHINFMGEVTPDMEPFVVVPNNPVRVFAV